MKSKSFSFSIIFLLLHHNVQAMDGGRVNGSMAREGMGFHQYHSGYHRSDGGYGYGRAYGAFGRHFGRYGHRGYGRYGDIGYVRKEADQKENIVAYQSDSLAVKRPGATKYRNISNPAIEAKREARRQRAIDDRQRGGQYWGYYSPHYQYGLYPWYNNGDPYYYYQRADYYPWYYGYNPGWLWW